MAIVIKIQVGKRKFDVIAGSSRISVNEQLPKNSQYACDKPLQFVMDRLSEDVYDDANREIEKYLCDHEFSMIYNDGANCLNCGIDIRTLTKYKK